MENWEKKPFGITFRTTTKDVVVRSASKYVGSQIFSSFFQKRYNSCRGTASLNSLLITTSRLTEVVQFDLVFVFYLTLVTAYWHWAHPTLLDLCVGLDDPKAHNANVSPTSPILELSSWYATQGYTLLVLTIVGTSLQKSSGLDIGHCWAPFSVSK